MANTDRLCLEYLLLSFQYRASVITTKVISVYEQSLNFFVNPIYKLLPDQYLYIYFAGNPYHKNSL